MLPTPCCRIKACCCCMLYSDNIKPNNILMCIVFTKRCSIYEDALISISFFMLPKLVNLANISLWRFTSFHFSFIFASGWERSLTFQLRKLLLKLLRWGWTAFPRGHIALNQVMYHNLKIQLMATINPLSSSLFFLLKPT